MECDKTSDTAATITLKWNEFASEWGMYTVDGCEGVGPKLKLTAGTVYTFDQSDASNWYHAVGFSYIAGGAHTECKDSTLRALQAAQVDSAMRTFMMNFHLLPSTYSDGVDLGDGTWMSTEYSELGSGCVRSALQRDPGSVSSLGSRCPPKDRVSRMKINDFCES